MTKSEQTYKNMNPKYDLEYAKFRNTNLALEYDYFFEIYSC